MLGWTHVLAFLHRYTVLDVYIEKMQLLIPLDNLAPLVNPQKRILDFLAVFGWLVDADIDGEFIRPGFALQTKHKLAVLNVSDEL